MIDVRERLPGAAAQRISEERGITVDGTPPARTGGLPRDRIHPSHRMPQTSTGLADAASSAVQQLLDALRRLPAAVGGRQYFQGADASSTGDPHLAFNGVALGGGTVQCRFDSMSDHPDLLDSDSFAGGYRIATIATQPGANGVTYNREATIVMNGGRTRVSLDKDGHAFVWENGRRFAALPGHSYALEGSANVTRNADGSLAVTETNPEGGSIATALSCNGAGVDVRTHAEGVDLGGDLLSRAPAPWASPQG